MLPVLDVQKALEVAHRQNRQVPSPGTVTGRWTRATQIALDNWFRTTPSAMDAYLAADVALGSQGPVFLSPSARSVLYTLAQIYDAVPRAASQSSVSLTPAVRPSINWVPIMIGGGALLVVGVGIWLYARR
jgi:hypothetical protein